MTWAWSKSRSNVRKKRAIFLETPRLNPKVKVNGRGHGLCLQVKVDGRGQNRA